MKVLYIHQFFNTPQDGGSIRSYYLASELVKKGYDVEMITSHTDSKKVVKEIDGIRVTYLPSDYQNSYGYWKRIRAYLGFAWSASIASTKIKGVDFCYVMTTPLTTGLIALFNKFVLRRPYIFEVGDLWPLVPIEMGVIKNRWLASLLYRFEKRCFKSSVGSIGLSPPITEYIQSKAPKLPTTTVYNVSDCNFFKPQQSTAEQKAKFGITNELVVTYTGTFGLANDLVRMIDVVANLQYLPVKFLFVGMGAEKEKVVQRVNELKPSNCQILDFQNKEGMKEILALSDAMFISFANYPSLFTGSPNKLFDALAAGMLIITNFDGWIQNLIETEQCGFSFVHDSAVDFESKIQPLLDVPSRLKTYKKNARQLAESNFDLSIQSRRQIEFLNELFG